MVLAEEAALGIACTAGAQHVAAVPAGVDEAADLSSFPRTITKDWSKIRYSFQSPTSGSSSTRPATCQTRIQIACRSRAEYSREV